MQLLPGIDRLQWPRAAGPSSCLLVAVLVASCVVAAGCRPAAEDSSGHAPQENVPQAAEPVTVEIPVGHPLVGGAGAAQNITVNYQLPEGWQPRPASGIRKVVLRVVDGPREALVSVSDFSVTAGPLIADPLANVNRWRSEVGLQPLVADDLSAMTEPVQVDSLQGIYVEAIPEMEESEEPNGDLATLATMANGGDVVWFIKITGDRRLVASQRDQFKSFLNSIRLTTGNEPKRDSYLHAAGSAGERML